MIHQNFSAAYLAKYPDGVAVVRHCAAALGLLTPGGDAVPVVAAGGGVDVPAIAWACFTRDGLRRIRAYFSGSADLCQNTGAQYAARIKSVLLESRLDGVTICPDVAKLLNLRQLRSHGVYVDNDRLHELEAWQVPTAIRSDAAKGMEIARLLFLISARTGCRAIDVLRLTARNIRNGLLTYVPQKTKESSGKVCVVPVGPKTIALIERVTDMTRDIDTSTPRAERSFYARYERNLKAVCALLPWDEEVIVFKGNEERVSVFRDEITTHVARHSFATNMYLDDEVGGDIYAIAQMLGHASVDMTMSYLCVPFNEKKMRLVKYFE